MLVETQSCIAYNTKNRCNLLSAKGKILYKYYAFMIFYPTELMFWRIFEQLKITCNVRLNVFSKWLVQYNCRIYAL